MIENPRLPCWEGDVGPSVEIAAWVLQVMALVQPLRV
jgi:hypothetical protein